MIVVNSFFDLVGVTIGVTIGVICGHPLVFQTTTDHPYGEMRMSMCGFELSCIIWIASGMDCLGVRVLLFS